MPQAIRNYEIQSVEDDEVDYELESPNSLLGSHVSLIPLPGAVQGTRAFYGARFFNQAESIVNGEAPLVQNAIDNDELGRSFDDHYGERAGAMRADDDYEVMDVRKDGMTLRNALGETVERDLYHQLPFNRKSFLSQRPVVKIGDRVAKGGMLAASNYTDDKGTLAMGLNARVGLVPYKGYSMDDAIVISQSFADRLKSQTTKTITQEKGNQNQLGRNHFQSLFPDKFTKEQLKTVDEDGVVLPGIILQPGDPIVLATKPRVLSSKAGEIGKLSKTMRQVRADASQEWEGSSPATVMRVAKTKKGVKVILSQESTTKEGDKITFRTGQKGTVSRLIPDEHMPRTVDGKPLEVLLNPQSLPSRANVSILYELLLGKVAAANGEPIKMSAFGKAGENLYDVVQAALDKAGLTDTEEVFDPLDNRKLENPITVGMGYVQKLHHTSESKKSARGQGAYDLNEQPARGGKEGAKRLSGLEVGALMSSGAYATLREGATIRGQKNDDYWRELREGNTPRDPDEPFAWKKFRVLMSGAGMQMKDEKGGQVRLGPMTDKNIDAYSPMEIMNSKLLNMRTLEPEDGGLFDKALVGNNKWGKITLPEPVANPAFEDTIRHLLGLKRKDLQAILAGEMDLPEELWRQRVKTAAALPPRTGPLAIQHALSTIDLDEVEQRNMGVINSGKVSKRSAAVQALNAVEGLRKNKVEPRELMISKVPVVPPAFRPFALIGDAFMPGDANELYKDLFDVRSAYTDAQKEFGDAGAIVERKALQNAVKAVYGYGDPVNPKTKQRGVSGFLRQLSGTSPKFSWFQRKLTSKTQDQVARGVITPDPELNMDQIGLPESMAWDMYGTHIMRRLVRNGMNRREALRQIKDRSKFARQALVDELPERPVVYSRSPAWHKYNIISATPTLIEGDTIKISPFVTMGIAGDFDGDTMNLHVPASADAVQEAKTILKPSSMLFSIRDQDKVVPRLTQEQILGPYAATQRKAKNLHRFPDRESALKAIRQGKISMSDEIEIPDFPIKEAVQKGLDALHSLNTQY